MKRFLIVVAVAAVLVPQTPSQAFLNGYCTSSTYSGVRIVHKKMKHGNATADVVNARRIDAYTFTIRSRGEHYFVVDGAGDIDLLVCKWNGYRWRKVCDSHNLPGMPDGCVLRDADLNGSNPGIGRPLGTGKYRAFLFNCSGTTKCDGLPAEAPVPYVAALK